MADLPCRILTQRLCPQVRSDEPFRLAVGSFMEKQESFIDILQRTFPPGAPDANVPATH